MRTILILMSPRRRFHLVSVLLLMLIGALAELVTIGAVLPFLTIAANPGSELAGTLAGKFLGYVNQDLLFAASLTLIAATFFSASMRFLLLWANQQLVVKFGQELALRVFSRTIRQNYSDHLRQNSSEILTGITKVQDVVYGWLQPSMQAVISGFTAICIAILLFAISPVAMGIGGAIIVSTYLIFSKTTSSLVRSNSEIIAETMTSRTKLLQESLGGFRDISLANSHDLFEKKFQDLDKRYRTATGSNNIVAGSPRFLIEAVGISALVVVTYVINLRNGGIGDSIPILGALALGAQRLLPLIQSTWNGMKNAAGHRNILDDVSALGNRTIAKKGNEQNIAQQLQFEDRLTFEKVSFKYGEEDFALRNLSFDIFKNEHIGITGETGAGKSTLLDLILGLQKPDDGEIQLDNKILDETTYSSWQEKAAYVPQAVFLTDDTIASNIIFGSNSGGIDLVRLEEAVRAAQLKPLVDRLPDGIETFVGERGIRLSGGQRQRIGIARALYGQPSVLVLDEATSALDPATEAAVLRAIPSLWDDLTIISVAHRASTLVHCDRVLTLSEGKIAGIT